MGSGRQPSGLRGAFESLTDQLADLLAIGSARGFAHDYPAMLLDEPTASLDEANRDTVLELIGEAKGRGAAIVGIFHDRAVRARVDDREVDVSRFAPGAETAAGQPVSG